jgi:hypothetical protein
MAAEKNLPAGRRLASPIGAALLLAALWIVLARRDGVMRQTGRRKRAMCRAL